MSAAETKTIPPSTDDRRDLFRTATPAARGEVGREGGGAAMGKEQLAGGPPSIGADGERAASSPKGEVGCPEPAELAGSDPLGGEEANDRRVAEGEEPPRAA